MWSLFPPQYSVRLCRQMFEGCFHAFREKDIYDNCPFILIHDLSGQEVKETPSHSFTGVTMKFHINGSTDPSYHIKFSLSHSVFTFLKKRGMSELKRKVDKLIVCCFYLRILIWNKPYSQIGL